MSIIISNAVYGTVLTSATLNGNFNNLANAINDVVISGDVSGRGGLPNISLTLANSGVTAGNYVLPNITVDSKGRITTISGLTSASLLAYPIACVYSGAPFASQQIAIPIISNVAVNANGGATAYAAGSAYYVGANPTANAVFNIEKRLGSNGAITSLGTLEVLTSGGVVANFGAFNLTYGDTFIMIAPASPDATLTNFSATINGLRE